MRCPFGHVQCDANFSERWRDQSKSLQTWILFRLVMELTMGLADGVGAWAMADFEKQLHDIRNHTKAQYN